MQILLWCLIKCSVKPTEISQYSYADSILTYRNVLNYLLLTTIKAPYKPSLIKGGLYRALIGLIWGFDRA